jgi:iron complex transport system substrate-binding protein
VRIVCLSAEAADICHRLGAWEQVVGVSAFARVPGLPKPVVSGFSSGNLSRVLSMAPDLVITFSDVQAQLAGDLIRMGCQVLALNCHSLEGVVRSIHLLGGVLGRTEAADHLARWFSGELTRLHFRPARRPRVYFEEWDDPPIAGIGWIQEVVRLAGGDPLPLGAGFKAKDRICSTEDVLRHDPEVILLSWCGKPANLAAVQARPGWANCTAVRDGWIRSVDPDKILQAGPALVEGLVAIRQVLAAWCAHHREPRHPPQVQPIQPSYE